MSLISVPSSVRYAGRRRGSPGCGLLLVLLLSLDTPGKGAVRLMSANTIRIQHPRPSRKNLETTEKSDQERFIRRVLLLLLVGDDIMDVGPAPLSLPFSAAAVTLLVVLWFRETTVWIAIG